MPMYTPDTYNEECSDQHYEFISEHSFATLLSVNQNGDISHSQTPLILSEDRTLLLGHLAKANPHWNNWDLEIMCIFNGPHCYISPSYYLSDFNVPTWNYQTLSVKGRIQLLSDREKQIEIMNTLVNHHEKKFPPPWEMDPQDPRYKKLFEMIVFFEIKIDSIQANFKLNQNKSYSDQAAVIESLNQSKQASLPHQIAQKMTNNLNHLTS